ncbi:tRNA guanosine(34) transglycosylase Tgt [Patescibacteria group bacterium]|nr:tRNA guanosine(34) transglycosylase Tgt [Patescibacteria group bacterium]MBU4367290.1 tRNA guanosine(34) transglycosylase Tgt [Patescibacteria group bacterium]MBU4461993.1 tRNA guanosine(34) transglycosylase Tgt [Patescibacteria group bacterium]MCG2700184.1 tRNA guanosine(34) transglycosylase Tgt [Candidatus Parcubacteria bacterium]
MEFKILKKSKKSRARLGVLKTKHGVIETPSLVPVATQAVVKTLTSQETEQTKSQILICNTFHLHLKPGEGVIDKSGGLHQFMNWSKPLMTDSGGFQVFSLGFGRDFNVGKILKYFPGQNNEVIRTGRQPKSMKITQDGVHFQSPLDGKQLFLGPEESIKIQEKLGADIIFAFDECTSPLADRKYIEKSLDRTHKWERICLDAKKSLPNSRYGKQALFGIVQGSHFKDLRIKSAKFINSLGFDGFGIGGDLGKSKEDMKKILDWTIPSLNNKKPRHLLGIGYLEDMEIIIKAGIDLFDCTVPTHYARRGIAFIPKGKLDLNKSIFLKDKNPIDKKCACSVCQNYKRNYITHLLRAGEITALKLLTFHNLYFFNTFVEKIREKIKNGRI